MAILSTLIKLSPVVAAPTIGAGFLAVHFEGTPMEEILPIEEVDNTPVAPLQPKRSSAPGKAGRRWSVRNVKQIYSSQGSGGACHLYVLEDHEDHTDSLIFRSYQKYDNLESAKQAISAQRGSITNQHLVQCNNKKFYLYRGYGGGWTFKMGEEEPVFAE
ncbi:hypothetical protein HF1_08080 [Mycoplasma haemofelis str. Langford 1]|uniref:Uncharacterized protein n=1 Tax=Mycoplasma haemofelis (strain Langford 1) TaxID=941640 RepID=E8ZI45_MYCHL|nr:hypothetical protein [Mycoplasma haemofelis]CBY92816.1 hypothetical protein HF1_08080 [Mycoplasma haemofelis str. Langford 1]